MAGRRLVRVAPGFFDRLDALLPERRTVAGGPSATDFLLHEMPPVIDRLADDFENVTATVPEAPGIRVHVTVGVLVARLAVYVVLSRDDVVEVVYLDIENPTD